MGNSLNELHLVVRLFAANHKLIFRIEMNSQTTLARIWGGLS